MTILTSAIAADPMLSKHVRHIDESKRHEIKAFICGLDALVVKYDLLADVDPKDRYFELNCWQLSMFAQHGPKDVDVVNVVLVH